MSLHFQYLGQGLSSQKTMELLQKHCSPNDHNKIADFGAVFDELLEQQKYKELIVSTLEIINLSPDKTLLQPIYSAISYWMTKLDSKEQQMIVDLFLKHIEYINEEAIFKTKIVAQLFNTLSSSQLSQNLFLNLLEFSKKWNTQQLIISPIISNIKEFLNLWTLNDKIRVFLSATWAIIILQIHSLLNFNKLLQYCCLMADFATEQALDMPHFQLDILYFQQQSYGIEVGKHLYILSINNQAESQKSTFTSILTISSQFLCLFHMDNWITKMYWPILVMFSPQKSNIINNNSNYDFIKTKHILIADNQPSFSDIKPLPCLTLLIILVSKSLYF
ncbi:unnamed protein product [Paramecium sonneborni]|uniref:Uncharacterized protein n=1 Tax=Paramecium sonneborni TaxID=65129 RepID=A0A8S1R660_9CILI|nr:unnamed protein product [Paramecium sonneborni]